MLKYLFILTVAFLGTRVHAQKVHIYHYVFDTFQKGKVKVKTGVTSEQTINYNILTNEMIYDDGGKFMAIGNAADVDTVFINDRKFVPVANKFYEVLTNTAAPLMMEFTATIEQPGASVGYGNASAATNATSINTLVQSGDVYGLKLPDDFKVTPGYVFYILKDGNYQKFSSAKQLANIFPDKKQMINDLLKKNKTKFSRREDLIALLEQISER